MMIKIFKQGELSGSEHIKYLFKQDEKTHTSYKPELVRGNPFITEMITNSITNKNKYVAGVLSFRDGEYVDEKKQLEMISLFENFVAPFEDKSRVNFLWVRHFDKNRLELHFMTPRQDLLTGKAFNIHPEIKSKTAKSDSNVLYYKHITSIFNYMNGFQQVGRKGQEPKKYDESNFQFSVKLVKDLQQKRADYIKSKYCEMKKTPYNKRTTTKKGVQNEREIDITKSRVIREKSNEPLVHSSNKYNNVIRRPEQINQEHSKSSGLDREGTNRNVLKQSKQSEINNVRNEREVQQQRREARTDSSISSKIQALNSLPFEKRRQELIALMNSSLDLDESISIMNELIKITGQINSQIGDLPTQQKKPKL